MPRCWETALGHCVQFPALREQREWYVVAVTAKAYQTFKRAEGRQRMADLRRARKSRRVAMAVQRRSSLFRNAAEWRLTNLAQFLNAMS